MVKYGVLGLLIEQRGYGYDLVQRLARRLGAAWQLNASAVYTALDQLEDDGLIEAAEGAAETRSHERPSRRSARVVYQATDHGIVEFQAWLARPSTRVDPIRSELQLKVALAAPDHVPSLLVSIAHEEWLIAHSLLEGAADPRAESDDGRCAARGGDRARPERTPAPTSPGTSEWPSAAAALVNAAAVMRLRGELAWLESARETLQRMSATHLGAVARVELPGAATR